MRGLHKIAPFLPSILREKIINLVYLFRKTRRSQKFKRLKQNQAIAKDKIISDLHDIGIRKGDIVLVHSSLTALGYIDGGAETIVNSLLETVGSTGTILMPTYSPRGFIIDWIKKDPVFDPEKDPSQTGKITEVFRLHKEVKRSRHPTHSVSAIGPMAEYLIKDHEKSDTRCGINSPFYKLIDSNGYLLALGSGFGHLTSFHIVEDVISNFPIKIYLKDRVPLKYIDEDGKERISWQKINDPYWEGRRIDTNPKKEKEIYDLSYKLGIVKQGNVGEAVCYLIKAKDLEIALEDMVKKGITIYD